MHWICWFRCFSFVLAWGHQTFSKEAGSALEGIVATVIDPYVVVGLLIGMLPYLYSMGMPLVEQVVV